MGALEFYQTGIGRTYYEHTLPEMLEAIKKQTIAMNRLAQAQEEANKIAHSKKEMSTEIVPEIVGQQLSRV